MRMQEKEVVFHGKCQKIAGSAIFCYNSFMAENKDPNINIPPKKEAPQKDRNLPEIIDIGISGLGKAIQKAHERAVEKELFSGSLEEFKSLEAKQEEEHIRSILEGNNSYKEKIGQEIFANSITFGTKEPSRLELLGPAEILRLKNLQNPQFLMLGANNKYSVQEFSDFSKKINPSSQGNIADVSQKLIPEFKDLQGEQERQIVIADARKMPYGENSMDLVCTNSLLNELINKIEKGKILETDVKNIAVLFREVYEKLKPGAAFIVVEEVPYPFDYGTAMPFLALESHLKGAAGQAGFERKKMSIGMPLSYILRSDIAGTEIDENGLADYGDKPLMRDSMNCVAMKFVK